MKHIEQAQCTHIAVRLPNWIGDAVMATATLAHLRDALPDARITAVAPPHILELFEGLSFFNDALPIIDKKSLIKDLASLHANLGLLLTGSFSSAWQFFRAHIPIRIGFSCHFRRLLLTHPVPMPYDEALHDVVRYRHLLSPLPITQPPYEDMELHLHVSEEEKMHMRKRLEESGLYSWHRLLIINPGAAYGEAKCWPKEFFKEILKALRNSSSLYIILVGAQPSIPLAEELSSLMPEKIISYAGKTSLRELMALISLADCLLTNDSGPMHIAAALKKPLIALFGSTNPLRTGPWHWGTVLYEKADCSPCYLRTCPTDFRCMKQISTKKVLATLHHKLKEHT